MRQFEMPESDSMGELPSSRAQLPPGGSIVIPGALVLALVSSFTSLAAHYFDRPAAYRAPVELVERISAGEVRATLLEGRVTQLQVDANGSTRELSAKLDDLTTLVHKLEDKIDRINERTSDRRR